MAESIDKLTVEKETLEKRYKSLQLEKDSFMELIQAKKTQVEQLEASVSNLTGQVTKMKETELLLLKYPDLYGPIEQLEELGVGEEMENQITANRHRIALLENLNSNLSNSVRKLNDSASRPSSTMKFQECSTRNQSLVINKSSIEMNTGAERDYFMKRNEANSARQQEVEAAAGAKSASESIPRRQYPLFRLEDELEADEARNK